MSRSLHLPPARSGETGWLWKLLPILAAGVVIALIWAERRNDRRNGARLGTTPAGAPPLPERDPARPVTAVNPLLERPAPYAAPATTAATPGSGSASAGEVETIPTPAEETTAIPRDEGEGWVRGDGSATCPPDYPIKGNATSRIYHRPGEASYEATVPEICFATETTAAEHGYRPRKR